jgi:acyl carrier protein
MPGALGEDERARLARSGVLPMSSEEALALLDAALAGDRAALVPARLNPAALRVHAEAGTLPPLLGGLVRARGGRAGAGAASLARRLAPLDGPERHRLLLDLVRGQVAGVLRHTAPGAVDPNRAFKDFGLDSLTALELRNRLSAATGVTLPATLVFDHPTASALAGYLERRIVPDGAAGSDPAIAWLERFEEALLEAPPSGEARGDIAARLQALLWRLAPAGEEPDGAAEADLGDATDEDLFAALDNELGTA